jgi:hypothetical protein
MIRVFTMRQALSAPNLLGNALCHATIGSMVSPARAAAKGQRV